MTSTGDREPLRVALVVNSLILGGAQHHIVKLCKRVAGPSVALSVFLLLRDEVTALPAGMPPDLSVSPFPRHHPKVLKWLGDELRVRRIDVVHSFLWYADAVGSLATLLFARDIPLISSERGERTRGLYSPLRRFYDRIITFRIARALCTNSDFGRDLLLRAGACPEKIVVIPNGVETARCDSLESVDLRRLLDWDSTCTVVGTVCRLVWYKGVDTFLRALAIAAARHDVRGVVIGDGPCRPRLEQLARDLGVEDRVVFLGTQTPVEPYVKGLDISVLATRTDSELCSNSILEYMACGKPVLATRVGGNPELVRQGETGILFEPDDAVGLGRAIESLASAPQQARVMGLAGLRRVEEAFRMDVVATRFVHLWNRVARGGRWG